MVITGHTRTYALLGHPVQHSRSPTLHNQWFKAYSINALYVALDVQPQRAEQVVTAFRTLGLAGANLTVPFKTAVIDQLDGITPLAKAIGAVNTVTPTRPASTGARTLGGAPSALLGDNTDWIGVVDALGCPADRLGRQRRAGWQVRVAAIGGAETGCQRAEDGRAVGRAALRLQEGLVRTTRTTAAPTVMRT